MGSLVTLEKSHFLGLAVSTFHVSCENQEFLLSQGPGESSVQCVGLDNVHGEDRQWHYSGSATGRKFPHLYQAINTGLFGVSPPDLFW